MKADEGTCVNLQRIAESFAPTSTVGTPTDENGVPSFINVIQGNSIRFKTER